MMAVDLFLDIEMLNYKSGGCDMNSMIAIGLTSLNGKFNFHSTIHPGYKKFRVSQRTEELTGITKEQLENSPIFPEVFQMLNEIFKAQFNSIDGVNFYTWGDADIKVWNNVCGRYQLQSRFNLIDFQKVLIKKCKLKKQPSLIKTLELVNKNYRLEHHNPLNDAKMLKSIYKKYKKYPPDVKLVLRRAEYDEDLMKLQQKYKDVLEFQFEKLMM